MDEIIIVEYDPRWSQQFEEEATTIWQVLGELVTQIEHFGSTAVPGLAAKPILDLLVGVHSLEEAKRHVSLLEALKYVYWQEDPRHDERMFLVKGMPPYGSQRTHHLHIVEADSTLWERVLFRDYLRSHPEEAHQYAALKHQLAECFQTDREAYTNAKTDYIQAIMAKARHHNNKN